MPRTLATLAVAAAMLAAALVLPAPHADAGALPVRFGMDAGSVKAQTDAGVKPDYGTFWVGPWTLTSGWGGPDGQLDAMRNAGVTPAVHLYYWGDDISPSCVENGCWSSLHNAQKDRAGWLRLAQQLTDHLNAKMAGKPVVIFVESEFNKGGIETYEPFDGYLADMAKGLKARYPASQVVLGFGNWGSAYWGNFDRAAAESAMVGIQGMRGSTRQSQADMMTLYDGLLAGTKTLASKFPGKPIMLTDIAVSSYPEPDYLRVQADVLAEVFANLAVLKSYGVQAMVYRTWQDNPNMNTANYYGIAERYWGLANSAGAKPSQSVWVGGVKAERAGSVTPTATTTGTATTTSSTTSATITATSTSTTTTGTTTTTSTTTAPPPPPAVAIGSGGGSFEVDRFAVRTAGGPQSDSLASGGTMFNLWSNGYVQQAFDVAPGNYVVEVRARGTFANGVAPHMDVTLGGAPLLSADPGTAYAGHQAPRSLAGRLDLRIAFTNDARTTTEDRNLVLDFVRFVPVPPNQAPAASFTWSADGLALSTDASASADPDGDAITYQWSFGDGAAATGPTASHTYASGGTYNVTVTVADGRGGTTTAQQAVTVEQPVDAIQLDAVGYKVKGWQKVDLAWSGLASAMVDVHRDGVKVATTANDGAYTDAINVRGGGSYAYTVCEAGTSTCSGARTVVF